MINQFENQVIEFRQYTKDMFMKMWNPVAHMAGLGLVVPENIITETVPGSPGSSIVRITFSEYNLSPRPESIDVAGKEDRILRAFVMGVFDKLGANTNKDVITVKDIRAGPVAATDLAPEFTETLYTDNEGKPMKWIEMGISKFEAGVKYELLWDCANAIALQTFARPDGFAYATDEQAYGLKSMAQLPLYQDPGKADPNNLAESAKKMRERIKGIAKEYLMGDLAGEFSKLFREFKDADRDLEPCYPDMQLPSHPVGNKVIYTEPDFYFYNPELIPYASGTTKAKEMGKKQIEGIEKLLRENSLTSLSKDDKITSKPSYDYRNKDQPVDLKDLQGTKDMPDSVMRPLDDFNSAKVKGPEGEVYTITSKNIYEASVEHARKNRELSMRKAFPTFRLHFVREGRDDVTYRGFHQTYGGFAVNEIRFMASRKNPTDMCIITLANLDGFLEVNQLDDIRPEGKQYKQDRLETDSLNFLYDYDGIINNQLLVWNEKFASTMDTYTVRKVMEYVRNNPKPNEFGPLGLTYKNANIATGKDYTSDQLSTPQTNLEIGVGIICRWGADMIDYTGQTYYPEVVAALFKFPELQGEIKEGVYRTEVGGQISPNWVNNIASEDLKKLVNTVRAQDSAQAEAQRLYYEQRQTELEGEIAANERKLSGIDIQEVVAEGAITIGPREEEAAAIREELKTQKAELERLSQELNTWVRRPPGEGIIFKEGMDVILRLGYSNDPEKLEVVFAGHVTEAHPGPGTITLLAQTFATEFLQEIKGIEEDMTLQEAFILGGRDVDGPRIAEWIMTQPEVKHYGRWENREESQELGRNERGRSLFSWRFNNTPVDDNVYLEEDPIFDFKGSRFTLNDRTLWQSLMDLTFRFPGYVVASRPYKDQRWWRNTLFVGRPDFTYLMNTPIDITQMADRVSDIKGTLRDIDAGGGLGFTGAEPDPTRPAEDVERQQIKAEVNELQKTRRDYFRKYHVLTGYHDIIDNGIILSKRDTYNAVRLRGRGSQQFYTKTLDGMDEQYMRWLYVENENATGGTFNNVGDNMATSILMWHLRDIYSGEITILGNPEIRPFDVCYLIDDYNDFSGPVEVEQVVHTMSPDVGFITQITPDLYNTVSDLPTRTNLGAFGVFAYRWALEHFGSMKAEEERVAETFLQQQNQTGVDIGLEATGASTAAWLALATLTMHFPLWGLPLFIGAYFLGGWLKDHATISISPLMHKGYPFVTGLHGFEAPADMNVFLRQFHAFRKGMAKDYKTTSKTVGDIFDPFKTRSIAEYTISENF